jgi:hypothetical protein
MIAGRSAYGRHQQGGDRDRRGRRDRTKGNVEVKSGQTRRCGGLYTDPFPDTATLPPAGYLQLSEGYADAAEAAEADGWPVIRVEANHLATLTLADGVAVQPGGDRR